MLLLLLLLNLRLGGGGREDWVLLLLKEHKGRPRRRRLRLASKTRKSIVKSNHTIILFRSVTLRGGVGGNKLKPTPSLISISKVFVFFLFFIIQVKEGDGRKYLSD